MDEDLKSIQLERVTVLEEAISNILDKQMKIQEKNLQTFQLKNFLEQEERDQKHR